MVAAFPARRRLDDYRGLARRRPWVGGALLVSLLGLVDTLPTAVFVGKLTIAAAAWSAKPAGPATVMAAEQAPPARFIDPRSTALLTCLTGRVWPKSTRLWVVGAAEAAGQRASRSTRRRSDVDAPRTPLLR